MRMAVHDAFSRRSSSRWSLLLLLVTALLLGALSLKVVSASSRPSLVLGGGNLSPGNTEFWSTFVELAGGPGQAHIGIVTAASIPLSWDRNANNPDLADNSQANAQYYIEILSGYGATGAWIPVDLDHLSNANNETLAQEMTQYTGFWFGGGDQSMLVYCLGTDSSASLVLSYLHWTWARNALVIGGTSAGTMAQVGFDGQGILPLITGGESYYAFTSGVGTYAKFAFQPDSPTAVTMSPYGGMGLFPYGLLDTHFSQRGRQGRLIAIAWAQSVSMAFGVDENTGLVLTLPVLPSSSFMMSVIGENGVSVFDLSGAYALPDVLDPRTGRPMSLGLGGFAQLLALMNVSWTYLTAGDSYDPIAKEIYPASGKQNIEGIESRDLCLASGIGSIFSANVLTSFATDLLDSKLCFNNSGQSYENQPLLTVQLREESPTQGWKGLPPPSSSPYNTTTRFSWHNLFIDIFPSFYIDTVQGS